MGSWLLTHEAELRLLVFCSMFLLMAGWEVVQPCRPLILNKKSRWLHNLLLMLCNTLCLRLLFPVAAVGVAHWAAQQQIGLFNVWQIAGWVSVIATLILLDLLIYWQHRLFHRIPFLWRFHRVHHADLDYDVTTAVRFHPIEIMLSMLIKFAAILVLGVPVVAVIVFEILLNAMAMFNHANIRLPACIEAKVRLLLVTPDMHRVHHSVYQREMHRNFGFNLSCWDRCFASYCAEPEDGQQKMAIGLADEKHPDQVNKLWGMLMLPLGRR